MPGCGVPVFPWVPWGRHDPLTTHRQCTERKNRGMASSLTMVLLLGILRAFHSNDGGVRWGGRCGMTEMERSGQKRATEAGLKSPGPETDPAGGGPLPRPGCSSLPSACRAHLSGYSLFQSRCWPLSVPPTQRCWEAGAELGLCSASLSPEVPLLSFAFRNRLGVAWPGEPYSFSCLPVLLCSWPQVRWRG